MKAILDDFGRIELPSYVQTHLGVKPGDELVLEEEDGRWVIHPATPSLIHSQSVDASTPEPQYAINAPSANENKEAKQRAFAPEAHDEDLGWKDLEYHSLPLISVAKVNVNFERSGQLTPIPHQLDGE